MTVSQLAHRVGTSSDTLRYYERIGILPPPDRSPAGYRLYGEDAVERVRFVKGAQRFGLRLEAIRELVEIRERGMCPCGHTRQLLEQRLVEVDREIGTLGRLRTAIEEMIEGPNMDGGLTATCTQDEAHPGSPARLAGRSMQ